MPTPILITQQSVQVFEDMPGAKGTATSMSIDYNITGAQVTGNPANDYNSVRAALLNYAPVSNAPPGATYAWPRRGLDLRENGWACWKATIQWASLNYQYAIKIGGSNQTIRCDKKLAKVFVAPNANVPAAWSAGAKGVPIGWDGRSVHGCSIYVPTRSWTESIQIPITDYSFDYEDTVDGINKAPVNSVSFRGWDPGEVLFHGMTAQLDTGNPDFVNATFEFEASWAISSANNNLVNIDQINGITKDGWDYLDVHYKPIVPNGTNALVPQAEYVLTHVVYDRSDFSGLNIGTSEALPLWQGPIQSGS